MILFWLSYLVTINSFKYICGTGLVQVERSVVEMRPAKNIIEGLSNACQHLDASTIQTSVSVSQKGEH